MVEVDDFLANLWKIHLQVKEEGYIQDLTLGMFRSDYMLHVPDDATKPSLKQVEFNTISSSFGGLAVKVAQLHTELATFPFLGHSLAYPAHPLFTAASSEGQPDTITGRPPPNDAVSTLSAALLSAHTAYGSSRSSPALPTCIVFLVQDDERNLFDQMALSSQLHPVPTFRLPASKILAYTSIPPVSENPSRPLIYTPPAGPTTRFEVSTVYFRALYAPTEYNTPTSWAARHHLERSAAIKCPSVLLHLSGSKKIQQVLTDTSSIPSILERFLPHATPETLTTLRDSFAPQYSMSDGPDSEGVRIALDPARAENHVLKPQREGGGNNIYRGKIPDFLKSIPEQDYKQYVLMELIQPPRAAKNTALRSDGAVVSGDVISELGIFGTCLWRSRGSAGSGGGGVEMETLLNEEGGYLMRTKARDSDEGGVAAGFSSLDSLVLFDEA